MLTVVMTTALNCSYENDYAHHSGFSRDIENQVKQKYLNVLTLVLPCLVK
jgi:hypothetical protein